MTNRYIDPDGDNGGAGTVGDPWKTIPSSCSQMSAKDTLLFNDGSYQGGTPAWANIKSGDAGGQTIFQAINSQQVVILTASNDHCIAGPDGVAYATWDGFVLDGLSKTGLYGFAGISTTNPTNYASDLVVKNLEIKNTFRSAIQTRCSDSLFQNIVIHDVGTAGSNLDHGIYTPVDCTDNIFEIFHIYNIASFGFQNYSFSSSAVSRNTYRRLHIHDCGKQGGWIGSGNDCKAYNLLIHDCDGNGLIIASGSGHEIYNITSCRNLDGIYIYPSPTTLTIRNSILIGNSRNNLANNASGVTLSNNITSGTDTDYFVDPANGDFNLKPQVAQSPAAIDGGVAVGAVTVDLFGRTRNDPPDIGAIEDIDPNTDPVNASDSPYTITTPNVYQALENITFADDEDNVERVTLTAAVAALKVNPAAAPNVTISTT